MTILYAVMFILSLLLPIFVFVKNKYKSEIWLFIIYISICIVNFGYLLISISNNLKFALFANKIAYLGNIFVLMSMFFLISKICSIKFTKYFKITFVTIGVLMFLLVCTSGYLDWYYKSAELIYENGSYKLIKEYGVLHPIYLIYVIMLFLSMIIIIFISLKKRKKESYKLVGLLITIVFGNIGMWIIEKIVSFDFEFLSISYLISEFVFFFIFSMIEDFAYVREVQSTTRILETNLSVEILSMTSEEKINKVMKNINTDNKLSKREVEILELLLENKKRKEIAEILHLSENTVKGYVRTLYNKLNVNNREELFALLAR